MSGTSLDGLDLVWVEFFHLPDGRWSVKWGPGKTVSYSGTPWEVDLPASYQQPMERLGSLSTRYALWCNAQIHQFLQEENLPQPDVIGHHGHTIHHQPHRGFTYQLGNTPEMARGFSCPVVGDFRQPDVDLGGQGAPLVPLVDRLLFSEYAHCVNLGGFANTSCEISGLRRAWDVVPLNILWNPLAQKLGHPFDPNGALAASGTLLPNLLNALESLPYFDLFPPKSLGREDVELHWSPLLEKAHAKHSTQDLLRTCVEHAARRLAEDLQQGPDGPVLVTGGGAHNAFFMEVLRNRTFRHLHRLPAHQADYKEAAAFAFLAALKLRGENNVLASVTGATHDHSSGTIWTAER
jgi:anhydro-N-acetylmuramic acid kinase